MSSAAAFDPAPAAALLADAWRSGVQMHALPELLRPRTLSEGYEVQDSFVAAMGDALNGWKLGVGSPLAMTQTGLGQPLVGRLLESRCHRSGDTIFVPGGAAITLEFEVAFVLARDVAPDGAVSSPLDVVAAMRTSFELVRSRFTDRRRVGWPSFAGDSVGFEALVVGEPIAPTQIDAITHGVVVACNGVEAARGLSGDELTDPIASLAALLAHARERGITLRQGEIVSAGAIARPFDFDGSHDAEIVARFPGGELRTRVRSRR